MSYSYDDGSRTLVLRYLADPGIAAPTFFAIPARTYPEGVAVSCDGCVAREVPGGVEVLRPPRGLPARIELRPALPFLRR